MNLGKSRKSKIQNKTNLLMLRATSEKKEGKQLMIRRKFLVIKKQEKR